MADAEHERALLLPRLEPQCLQLGFAMLGRAGYRANSRRVSVATPPRPTQTMSPPVCAAR